MSIENNFFATDSCEWSNANYSECLCPLPQCPVSHFRFLSACRDDLDWKLHDSRIVPPPWGWLSLECLFNIFRVSSTIRPTLNHGSSYFPAAVTLLVLYSLAQLCSDWNRIRWLWRDSPDCNWHDCRGTRAVMVGLTVTVELLIIFMTVGQRPWFDRVVLRRLQVRQMDCMPWLWIVYSCRLRLSLWFPVSLTYAIWPREDCWIVGIVKKENVRISLVRL